MQVQSLSRKLNQLAMKEMGRIDRTARETNRGKQIITGK